MAPPFLGLDKVLGFFEGLLRATDDVVVFPRLRGTLQMDQTAQDDPESREEGQGSAEGPPPIRQRDPAAGSRHEERTQTHHQRAEE